MPADRARFDRIMLGVLVVVFAGSALSKLTRPESAERAVKFIFDRAGTGQSRAVEVALVGALIGWEMLLALGMAAGGRVRRQAIGLCAATLLVLSGVLVFLLVVPAAPGCGCLGSSGEKAGLAELAALARNALLFAACVWLLDGGKGLPAVEGGDRPGTHRLGRKAGAGFTLIETLACITIVAIVLSLVIPSLRDARASAKEQASQGLARQLAMVAFGYAHDWKDALPFFATPRDPWSPAWIGGRAYGNQPFDAQARLWLSFLANEGRIEPVRDEMFLSPEQRAIAQGFDPRTVRTALYFMTFTAFSAPDYWSPGRNGELPPPDALLHGQKLASVRWPSAKGLLCNMRDGYWRGRGPAAMAHFGVFFDGSAGVILESDVNPGSIQHRPLPGRWAWPIMSTTDGLFGRDR